VAGCAVEGVEDGVDDEVGAFGVEAVPDVVEHAMLSVR
jgi:hypothetical protein